MRRAGIAGAFLLAVAAAVATTSAHASSQRSCGTIRTHQGGSPSSPLATFKVIVTRGSVSCATAKRVAYDYQNYSPPVPAGWRCSTVVNGVCTKGSSSVETILTNTPGSGQFCSDIQASDGVESATSIFTTSGSCASARSLAKQFMDSPDCAINFQTANPYDCFLLEGSSQYHCTGTIDTVRQSSIECDLTKQKAVIFDVVD